VSNVLTTQSTIPCGHGGAVQVTSTAKLTVNGGPALLLDGISGKPIAGCLTTPASDASGPTAKQCLNVTSVGAGAAGKLTAGGSPVMLDTVTGGSDGLVNKVLQQLGQASANQTKLTTV
jgi:hypothetical protein